MLTLRLRELTKTCPYTGSPAVTFWWASDLNWDTFNLLHIVHHMSRIWSQRSPLYVPGMHV